MKVLGIDYTFFGVNDMQRAIAFYRDLLGIPLARLILEETWAEFEINPGTLVLYHLQFKMSVFAVGPTSV